MANTFAHPRISPWQAAMLIVTMMSIEGSTEVSRLLTAVAVQDVWIAALLSMPLGMLSLLIILSVARRRPLELFPSSNGYRKLFYALLGIAYLALFIVHLGLFEREFTQISSPLLPSTPPAIVLLALLSTVLFSNLIGIEAIARVNVLLLLFADIPLGVLVGALIKGQQSLARLLPIAPHGLAPTMLGVQLILGTVGEIIILVFLLPVTSGNEKQQRRALLWGVSASLLFLLGHTIGPLMLFGNSAAQFAWLALTETTVVQAATFISHLEVMAFLIWIPHGYWLETTLFIWCGATLARYIFGGNQNTWTGLLLLGSVFGYIFLGTDQGAAAQQRWLINADGFLLLGLLVPTVGVLLWRRTSPK